MVASGMTHQRVPDMNANISRGCLPDLEIALAEN
jgi:hypothetical protein